MSSWTSNSEALCPLWHFSEKSSDLVARPSLITPETAGFEPMTPGTGTKCSNHSSVRLDNSLGQGWTRKLFFSRGGAGRGGASIPSLGQYPMWLLCVWNLPLEAKTRTHTLWNWFRPCWIVGHRHSQTGTFRGVLTLRLGRSACIRTCSFFVTDTSSSLTGGFPSESDHFSLMFRL